MEDVLIPIFFFFFFSFSFSESTVSSGRAEGESSPPAGAGSQRRSPEGQEQIRPEQHLTYARAAAAGHRREFV